jgi:hypothetical protein
MCAHFSRQCALATSKGLGQKKKEKEQEKEMPAWRCQREAPSLTAALPP